MPVYCDSGHINIGIAFDNLDVTDLAARHLSVILYTIAIFTADHRRSYQ
jgi:hypothetical protein